MAIRQGIEINATAQPLFNALTDAEQFCEFTGERAEIDARIGGQFSRFDGIITGVNLELILQERIVQAWRVANWEPGVYSIVKFGLEEVDDSKTHIIFAVPAN